MCGVVEVLLTNVEKRAASSTQFSRVGKSGQTARAMVSVYRSCGVYVCGVVEVFLTNVREAVQPVPTFVEWAKQDSASNGKCVLFLWVLCVWCCKGVAYHCEGSVQPLPPNLAEWKSQDSASNGKCVSFLWSMCRGVLQILSSLGRRCNLFCQVQQRGQVGQRGTQCYKRAGWARIIHLCVPYIYRL